MSTGLGANGFLAGQLAWPAWVRLAVLSGLLALAYAELKRRRQPSRVDITGALSPELLSAAPGEIAQQVWTQKAPFSLFNSGMRIPGLVPPAFSCRYAPWTLTNSLRFPVRIHSAVWMA